MATLAVIGIVLFISYTLISVITFGVPKSLSESYYLWLNKNPKLEWPFRTVLALTAFLLIPAMLWLGEESVFQFTGFLTPACLAMVGAASDYANTKSVDRWWHPVSAYICTASAILWEIFIAERIDFLMLAFALFVVLSAITKTTFKSYIFWLEMTCFFSIFACLIKILYF